MTATTTPHPTAQQLRPVLEVLATLVDGIQSEDLGQPTPCTELTVGQLRDHVTTWLTIFAQGYEALDGKAPDATAVVLDDDRARQIRTAAATLLSAVDAGAAERPLDLGGQAMPGEMALSMILWEYQVHGWDLARATGQVWDPAAVGLELSIEFAPGMLTPDFQGEGKAFAPRVVVAEDAAPLERLVALSGRNPSWPS